MPPPKQHPQDDRKNVRAAWSGRMIRPQQRVGWDVYLFFLLTYITVTIPYRMCFGVDARGAMKVPLRARGGDGGT